MGSLPRRQFTVPKAQPCPVRVAIFHLTSGKVMIP